MLNITPNHIRDLEATTNITPNCIRNLEATLKHMKRKKVVVFGIFDGVHEGHRNFFKQAIQSASGNAELILVVGRDSAALELKKRRPRNPERKRLALVLQEPLVSRAVLGDKKQSTYHVLEKLKPDIICLGYDQLALFNDLKKWLKKSKRKIKLIRLKAYKPYLYHTSLGR